MGLIRVTFLIYINIITMTIITNTSSLNYAIEIKLIIVTIELEYQESI